MSTTTPTITRVGQRGELRLELAQRGDRTALRDRYWSAPFGPVWANHPGQDGTAELQITNPAGGVLGGDAYEMQINLGPGSSATLLSQGANRIYRGPPASQHALFHVEDGACLEYLPHHLIPFAGSHYQSENEFRLSAGSTLITWEAHSAGRISRGERFAFDRLCARTRITRDGLPLIVDGLDLPGGGEPFAGYDYTSTLYVCSPGELGGLAGELHSFLDALPGTLASASAPERGLCTGRVLARNAPALYRALNGGRRVIRRYLGLSPPVRDLR
ncbi:urease accessory protein UreD [Rubrobacter aplysinae]|uniref:urease accessory protein UreD n=1 Tax=Rubrobacter aplysinae TaxID=909625 RepID=UPI00064B953B|nr:urease accessory protein UreD [Rubrobacter aplysinae]